MAEILPPPQAFEAHVETLIVGAGACGLIAALSAAEQGQDVLILERDEIPSGSTALSAGLIPAAGTQLQIKAGISDSPTIFAADIQKKASHENDPGLVSLLAEGAAKVIDWLAASHGLPFTLVDDFDYPGHSARRMHGLPSRSGAELIDALRSRCEAVGIDIICNAPVDALYAEGRHIRGVRIRRPDGQEDRIGCGRLILACNGFGGNRDKVRAHMPEIADGLWFGHDGNQGDALDWGQSLGAQTRHLGAYQGHGNVAHPHGILVTWAVIAEGGIQVNARGNRFWNESQGYSEAARAVLAQPGGTAITIFGTKGAEVARQFKDFRDAENQGAICRFETLNALASAFDLPLSELNKELDETMLGQPDRFGRVFGKHTLEPPFFAVRVTGALFHTQGGLAIDDAARVVDGARKTFPNLYAAGGAACGVSGAADSGYLSGNGLLAASVLGYIAGRAAPVSATRVTGEKTL
ncbi:FAD-dependent oxidoreductase [Thalassococcus sp. S3]|uniref:FAD-dependent oxidoreductase n=1 Tax=Thalassococcus sp. S3 TaxID=2017482 RepID=UPI0010244290|nr:FAD-dependent oxidoreductase [Thalassococcus sp. S3]QBF33913.1 3-ketosteroid dehydrogenase [Thalassococcus sp. S3]